MNSNVKTLIFWVVLICVAVLLFAVVRQGQGIKEDSISFTQFLEKVRGGEERPGFFEVEARDGDVIVFSASTKEEKPSGLKQKSHRWCCNHFRL